MVRVSFTQNLQQHVVCPPFEAPAATVREALEHAFARYPTLRGYVLDDQGAVRKHMAVFVDGHQIRDRAAQTDTVRDGAEVYVLQALSGG